MAHHPTGLHGGGLGQVVHGAMIVFLALAAFGFASFAAARGAARPAILAGLIAYALALFGHAGAATINGFVVPALAARGAGAGDHAILVLAWEANQALAKLGVAPGGERAANRTAERTADKAEERAANEATDRAAGEIE